MTLKHPYMGIQLCQSPVCLGPSKASPQTKTVGLYAQSPVLGGTPRVFDGCGWIAPSEVHRAWGRA
ncbi:MAG: hypothetical protein KDA55_15065, partial [Planctomycetales bacterium]|nr:hypothetical protein [Planctomycetales bacterium]